jgi:hypothetical protein
MPKKPDPLDDLSPAARAKFLHDVVHDMFGAENGAVIWKQMDAALRSKARQLGDAPEPEKNHWHGAWKIYELE